MAERVTAWVNAVYGLVALGVYVAVLYAWGRVAINAYVRAMIVGWRERREETRRLNAMWSAGA